MKPYELPPLDYDYAALEPHYSARVLELHHDKHHKAYVDGLNTTLQKLAAARASDDLSAIVGLEKRLAFNLSGHVLHTLFWKNLSPDGGDRPDGELAAAIDEDLERALLLREAGKGDADVYRIHGHFGEPCPLGHDTLRRVAFEEHTITYCPTCQTGGKELKDRRLSRLLR